MFAFLILSISESRTRLKTSEYTLRVCLVRGYCPVKCPSIVGIILIICFGVSLRASRTAAGGGPALAAPDAGYARMLGCWSRAAPKLPRDEAVREPSESRQRAVREPLESR